MAIKMINSFHTSNQSGPYGNMSVAYAEHIFTPEDVDGDILRMIKIDVPRLYTEFFIGTKNGVGSGVTFDLQWSEYGGGSNTGAIISGVNLGAKKIKQLNVAPINSESFGDNADVRHELQLVIHGDPTDGADVFLMAYSVCN